MVDTADDGTIGFQDCALILLVSLGAFRRSKLLALDIADCAFGKEGTHGHVVQEQDQSGRRIPRRVRLALFKRGSSRAISRAAPLFRSVSRLCEVQGGPLSGIDVARIVKKLALRAGSQCYGVHGSLVTGPVRLRQLRWR